MLIDIERQQHLYKVVLLLLFVFVIVHYFVSIIYFRCISNIKTTTKDEQPH